MVHLENAILFRIENKRTTKVGEKVEHTLPCEKSQSEKAVPCGSPTKGRRWQKDQWLLGIEGKEVMERQSIEVGEGREITVWYYSSRCMSLFCFSKEPKENPSVGYEF